MIPLLRYNVLVSTVLNKLSTRAFIAKGLSPSFYWSQVTSTLCKQDISLRRRVAAGPEGLHQRES